MKAVSWNVNGLRACLNKGFANVVQAMNADFFCVQETKLQAGQLDLTLPGYTSYWDYAEKKGYAGTAIFTKEPPLSVSYGIGSEEHGHEGRCVTLEYPNYYLITLYSPNSQEGLRRLSFRLSFEAALRRYLKSLDMHKPLILCGDFNVAHQEIDLKNPGPNRGNAGFSDEEREAFVTLLASGFTDTFRLLHPNQTGAYSWWSYRFNARRNNAGWRIDYFLVSERLAPLVTRADILSDILGSDHCPVFLELSDPSRLVAVPNSGAIDTALHGKDGLK